MPPETDSLDEDSHVSSRRRVHNFNPLAKKWSLAIAIFAVQVGALILNHRLFVQPEVDLNPFVAWALGIIGFAPSFKLAGLILGIQHCTWTKSVLLPLPNVTLNTIAPLFPILFWWYGYLASFVIMLLWSNIMLRLTTLGIFVYVILVWAVIILAYLTMEFWKLNFA